MSATVIPGPWVGSVVSPLPAVPVTAPALPPEDVQLVAQRLDAGTLEADCPACGYGMRCKRDRKGYPFSHCPSCRLQLAARSIAVQAWWLRLVQQRLEREREEAQLREVISHG
jgi:hypothetical protein